MRKPLRSAEPDAPEEDIPEPGEPVPIPNGEDDDEDEDEEEGEKG